MMIEAKRKDGTPARKGDTVFCQWQSGITHVGYILKVRGPMQFGTMNNVTLQIYNIRCGDGQIRTIHAWHIKKIFGNSNNGGIMADEIEKWTSPTGAAISSHITDKRPNFDFLTHQSCPHCNDRGYIYYGGAEDPDASRKLCPCQAERAAS